MNVCERFDFPHAPVWCPECYAKESQAIIAREAIRANDLKEREVLAKEQGIWREPEVQVVRQYTPYRPQTPQQPKSKGGIPL